MCELTAMRKRSMSIATATTRAPMKALQQARKYGDEALFDATIVQMVQLDVALLCSPRMWKRKATLQVSVRC